jgi:hypothetical protein
MNEKPVRIRKHAILKRHYRRAVAATPQFHQLDTTRQWAVLREHVDADPTPLGTTLKMIMDSRAARRDEVLAALEQARRNQISS